MKKLSILLLVLVAAAVAIWYVPLQAAVRPPKLEYQRLVLPNGMVVILHQDKSTPIVHVELWYHVGSKNEKPGRTGFAHFFEHLMFKGSRNVEPEQHTSIIASVGGQANAYTNEDTTVFWQTIPAQYLPLVMWMEADRMASLRIDEKTFVTEREVVKEERRMRIENPPFGLLNELITSNAFDVHPYKHPVIGSMTDLNAATIDDVRDFYKTYYVPENATMMVVGDFDTDTVTNLVNQYFARVPKAAKPVPRDIPQEPQHTKEKRVTLEQPWPLPAVDRHLSRAVQRPSGFVSDVRDVEDAVGRADLAHLSKAGLRNGPGADRVWQQQLPRAARHLLGGRARQSRQVAGRGREGADRGVRQAQDRRHHRA